MLGQLDAGVEYVALLGILNALDFVNLNLSVVDNAPGISDHLMRLVFGLRNAVQY